jgi:O-antigen/teichoic acid export membrane protein
MVLVAVIGAAATLGTSLFSDAAVAFIGGPAYAEIEPIIGWFALLGTILALIQLTVYEVVARQLRASVWLFWAALLAVAAATPFVASEQQLLATVLAVDTILLVVLVAVTSTPRRTTQPADFQVDR